MADMASLPQVTKAWEALSSSPIVPITYMNSTAEIKALCGEHGGTICTSSNARQTFEWGFKKADRVFFLPDEHLGRNTALKAGVKESEIATWDPAIEDGGEPERYASAKVILWKGHCPVHLKFTVRDVEHVRRYFPKAKLLVHPECPKEVAELADAVGSTSFIKRYVTELPEGSEVFIGTEINLVENLAKDFPRKKIHKLHRSLCLTMYQITLGRLLYSIENRGSFEKVCVPESISHYSRVALDRMMSITERAN
jgi:quinolinate synthase